MPYAKFVLTERTETYMKELLYLFPTVLAGEDMQSVPGVKKFALVTSLLGYWVMPLDRTGTIKIPVRTKDLFPMPRFRPLAKSFEELCDERARELLDRAEKFDISIYMMYSGGIDSTCMLVSLLKHATPAQKKRLVVLLSHESIVENQRFYDDHIRGKLRVESSVTYPRHLGTDGMFLTAEHSDHVMGNAAASTMIARFGARTIHQSYERELLTNLFAGEMGGNLEMGSFYFDIFDRIAKAAPIEIRTNFDFLWWCNFTTKWQAAYLHMLFFAPSHRSSHITYEYLATRFVCFYNTEEFQLWGMNNLDKRIKDSWVSYKWVMKDVIFGFNGDADYRDHKLKVRSFQKVGKQLQHANYLDTDLRFHRTLEPHEFLDPENDFI